MPYIKSLGSTVFILASDKEFNKKITESLHFGKMDAAGIAWLLAFSGKQVYFYSTDSAQ